MNPNPIASYIRHLITAGILLVLAKYKFPLEGADAFADGFALAVLGTLTWLVVKYLPALAKHTGLLAVLLTFSPSCGSLGFPVRASIFLDGAQVDYSSKSGLSIGVDVQSIK